MPTIGNVEQVVAPPKPVEDFVYVTIPSADLYDSEYPTIQLNSHKFEPGNTYKVSAEVGAEIEDRMRRFNKEQVRLLRPTVDSKSINQVNKGSYWTKGANVVGDSERQLASLAANERVVEVRW
jgi:hypothetical protein